MAYLEEYNKIVTDGGYTITLPERIRQYVVLGDHLVVRVASKEGDAEFNDKSGGVFCYDSYGKLLWSWIDQNIFDIRVKNNTLLFYNPNGLGYQYEIDVKTGGKKKINIVK